MPNWCSNLITISGEESEIARVVELVEQANKNEDNFFSLILPMPSHLEGTVSNGKTPDFDEKGEPINWYSWRQKYWGTKWDSCGLNIQVREDREISLYFSTAWNPALPVMLELSKLIPNSTVTHRYYELGCCFVGSSIFKGGQTLYDECHEADKETMAHHGFETDYFDDHVGPGGEVCNIKDGLPEENGEDK